MTPLLEPVLSMSKCQTHNRASNAHYEEEEEERRTFSKPSGSPTFRRIALIHDNARSATGPFGARATMRGRPPSSEMKDESHFWADAPSTFTFPAPARDGSLDRLQGAPY